jgi:two-component system chemotaxis sensor kinase CheA
MSIDDAEMVREFLTESYENLDRLDRELVSLERDPQNRDALAGVFRTIHTIKGTCGFLGLGKLEKVAHVGENLLSLLRDGKLLLTPEITTALLAMVDAVRQILGQIQATGQEGNADNTQLLANLTRLHAMGISPESASAGKPAPPVVQAQAPPVEPKPEASPKQEVVAADPTPEPVVKTEAAAPKAEASPKAESVPAASGTSSAAQPGSNETIRVGVTLLDKLMTLVGELVLARNQLMQYSNRVEDAGLQAVTQRMNLISTELQEEVMKTRMQPIGNVWSQFPRTVRDVAIGCGKEVAIEMEGKETELDKTIIEAIKDPLTHLVRNSVDHGIELPEARVKAGKPRIGRLTLRAFHEGGQVNIEISDDGGGLNRERIRQKAIERGLMNAEQAARMNDREVFNLIFMPGFSTAEKVTNVSGRGVGMDVVKTNVEKIGGTVDVQSAAGQGTTVRVKIPLTLAIIPALIVTCAGDRYAIPQVSLLELVRLEAEQVRTGIELVHGVPVYRLRGQLLPLVYLRRELKMADPGGDEKREQEAINIVVLQADGRQFGLMVDKINDTQEIVVKPLGKQLKIKTFAGASIMGDGKIALILDVMGLAQRANVVNEAHDHESADMFFGAVTAEKDKQTFLLFTGPDNAHMAVPLDTLARLEEFPASQVERSGTRWVTQYRGEILPLVKLAYVLKERRKRLRHPEFAQETEAADARIQVLVCNHQGQRVGLVVERIVDIVDDTTEVRYPASRAGVLCSAVVQGKVTELIDIPAILQSAGLESLQPQENHAEVVQ